MSLHEIKGRGSFAPYLWKVDGVRAWVYDSVFVIRPRERWVPARPDVVNFDLGLRQFDWAWTRFGVWL